MKLGEKIWDLEIRRFVHRGKLEIMRLNDKRKVKLAENEKGEEIRRIMSNYQ